MNEASSGDAEAVSHVGWYRASPPSRLLLRRPLPAPGRNAYVVDVEPRKRGVIRRLLPERRALGGPTANAAERRVSCWCRRRRHCFRFAALRWHWRCQWRCFCWVPAAGSCAPTDDECCCCRVEIPWSPSPCCCAGTDSATSAPHQSMALEVEFMFRGNGALAEGATCVGCGGPPQRDVSRSRPRRFVI